MAIAWLAVDPNMEPDNSGENKLGEAQQASLSDSDWVFLAISGMWNLASLVA